MLPLQAWPKYPPSGANLGKDADSGMVAAASDGGHSMTAKDGSGFYYGWVIAIASGLILLVTNGMTLGGLNVFDKPLLDALSQAGGEPVSLAAL